MKAVLTLEQVQEGQPSESLTNKSATQISLLLKEIQTLTEAEKKLERRRIAIHTDELCFMFSIGEKVQALREALPYGQYKPRLAEIGVSWASADRKRKAYLIFGEHRDAPWIINFGKSARQELAYYHFQKKNNRADGLVKEAIALAQSGTEVGVAWVFARIEGRQAQAGERKSRLSKKIREAVHFAIEEYGEERVLEAIASLAKTHKSSPVTSTDEPLILQILL